MSDLMKSKGNKPRKGHIKECPTCKQEFYTRPSGKNRIFCSVKCYQNSNRGKVRLICLACKKEYLTYIAQVRHRGSSYCSRGCYHGHMGQRFSGENSPSWKGENICYSGKHRHIRNAYGKADRCENPDCEKISAQFEWALKHGHDYTRNPEDYFQLCKKCHRNYDKKPKSKETILKMSKAKDGAPRDDHGRFIRQEVD